MLILSSSAGTVSCNYIERFTGKKQPEAPAEEPIARVRSSYLYPSDIAPLLATQNGADSANFVRRYVQTWIKKQLLISKASESIDYDQSEIERKVQDYRYSLMIYEYQQNYIKKEMEMEVTEGQIMDYYEENTDNFKLKQNIIRCRYVKLPTDAPNQNRFRRLFVSTDSADIEELRSYCFRFAKGTYNLDDSTWVTFDDVIKESPLAQTEDKIRFLRNNRRVEVADSVYNYYLWIIEYRTIGDISPLEFEKDNIRNIIVNKRKVELAQEMEDEIYNEALSRNEFEIY